MSDPDSQKDEVTLELLEVIGQRNDISQRHLADKLGIALGLTNAYLKRCAKKGYVKIKEVPANRYLYFVTPKGFAEKSRLTARFLTTSLSFYRQSAESFDDLYALCHRFQWERVMLCGVSDLAEIAYMRSVGFSVKIEGIYDPGCNGSEFSSLPVWREWKRTSDTVQACIITDLDDPLKTYSAVLGLVREPKRVLVPRVLGLEDAIKDLLSRGGPKGE